VSPLLALGSLLAFSPLEPIERVLTWLLEWLHTAAGLPWAWAIVATTIIVRVLLVPLTIRQIHSMQNLQAHAPEMKEIQKRYKGDRQKMNEELMKFYKENNINPASSCLPIVAQIPVFIALFFVLRGFEQEVLPRYEDSPLGWLGVVPSIIEPANAHWSGYLLLTIYAISQTSSTLLMSTTMERMQRTLLLILPLAFLFFILRFPAGLVLYWVTTNLWTTGQGLITRRLVPKREPPPKRTSRTPPKAETDVRAADADGESPKAQQGPPRPPRKVKRKKKARR
jgi:YidC/Oxa1 family membrane protein insertase